MGHFKLGRQNSIKIVKTFEKHQNKNVIVTYIAESLAYIKEEYI